MMRIFPLLFFQLLQMAVASDDLISLSVGQINLGETRIPINLDDFRLNVAGKKKNQIQVQWVPDSLQWVRPDSNLLIPRARVGITIDHQFPDLFVRYQKKSFFLMEQAPHQYSIDLYVMLFDPGELEIYQGKEKVGEITVQGNPPKGTNLETVMIDYSCAKYNIKISGLENEYLSVGCRLDRHGPWGNEHARLEITWSSTNLRLPDQSNPPYYIILTNNRPVKFTVEDRQGNKKHITIEASLPHNLSRVKTSLGFGPYFFRAEEGPQLPREAIAPSLMLYGKLEISKDTSFRLFNALIWQKSFFNNFGLYFAYEMASMLDHRIQLVPLLGIQSLTFRFDGNGDFFHHIIYPQGFEVVYNHAFNIENYQVVYGMFLSTSGEVEYSNAWLRWGKKYFWEINYIDWRYQDHSSATWGISVVVPFLRFL